MLTLTRPCFVLFVPLRNAILPLSLHDALPIWYLQGRLVQMNRKGFTLIELLIVVVIIGILAAIAIPKFANTKEKAYLATMKSHLRNLVTDEEAYFADSVKYTTNLGTAYATTSGVVGPTIAVTADGWTARVSHTTTTKTCAIYVGSTAPAPASKEGEPQCR